MIFPTEPDHVGYTERANAEYNELLERVQKAEARVAEFETVLRHIQLGGWLVSTARCSEMEIAWARSENRMLVDESGHGYVVRPSATFPTSAPDSFPPGARIRHKVTKQMGKVADTPRKVRVHVDGLPGTYEWRADNLELAAYENIPYEHSTGCLAALEDQWQCPSRGCKMLPNAPSTTPVGMLVYQPSEGGPQRIRMPDGVEYQLTPITASSDQESDTKTLTELRAVTHALWNESFASGDSALWDRFEALLGPEPLQSSTTETK